MNIIVYFIKDAWLKLTLANKLIFVYFYCMYFWNAVINNTWMRIFVWISKLVAIRSYETDLDQARYVSNIFLPSNLAEEPILWECRIGL